MKNDLDLQKWSNNLKSAIELQLKNKIIHDGIELPESIELIPQELLFSFRF